MLRIISRYITDIVRNDIRNVHPSIQVGFVVDKKSKIDIYKLRYDVMVRGKTVFPPTHYCIKNGDEFRDDYDDDPSTKHFLVRKNGKPVASCRLVDGKKVKLEMEKFNWFDVRLHIWNQVHDVNNIVEPTRVVASKSVSGSYIAPLMLTHCLLDIYDSKYESMIGTVNADAINVIRHYQKFMPSFKQLSDTKFAVNEFIPGRSCHAFILRIGATEKERDLYILTTLFPCFLLYKMFNKR